MASGGAAGSESAGVLVLAAGQSRRFGSQKLMQPLADGRPMLLHSLEVAESLGLPVTLVVDAQQPELLRLLQGRAVQALPVEQADQGMGANLARGVTACSDWQGWLVMLGDMPFIKTATLKAVMAQASVENIVVPVFRGQRGHPVWFGRSFKEQLIQLSGDQGGRGILQSCWDQVAEMAVDDPAIHWDVDTPAELQQLLAQYIPSPLVGEG